MGELIDATGDTQYNVFKRLEAKGHPVRRDGAGRGMRIWLKHRNAKDGSSGVVEDDLPEEASEPTFSEVERCTLSLERDLQRAVRNSLDRLEPGLVATDGGRENGFRDITANDQAGNIVKRFSDDLDVVGARESPHHAKRCTSQATGVTPQRALPHPAGLGDRPPAGNPRHQGM